MSLQIEPEIVFGNQSMTIFYFLNDLLKGDTNWGEKEYREYVHEHKNNEKTSKTNTHTTYKNI